VTKKKKDTAPARSARKSAVKKRAASVQRAVASGASTVDTTLLIGGVALVILVLGDTVFLALSTRFLRAG
jgi:Flp pilus assembly pilin Flp